MNSPEGEDDGEEPLHGDGDGGVDGAGAERVKEAVDHRQNVVVDAALLFTQIFHSFFAA